MDNNKLLNYNYIYNTLEKPTTADTDSTLKVGSKVENLLIELSDETIWNANFKEYYGDEKPAQCWEPCYLKTRSYSNTVSGRYRPDSTSIYDNPIVTKVPVPGRIIYLYQLKYTYDLSGLLQDNLYILDIVVNNATPAELDARYEYDIDNKKITFYFYSEKPRVSGSYSFNVTNVEGESGDNDTIKNGRLDSSSIVKENTSYVLQVINSTSPKDGNTNKNTITIKSTDGNERSIQFDNYLFFKTGQQEKHITLSIYGLSYGYKVYDQEKEVINSIEKYKISEMRCFKTDNKAKIFLFETNLPWAVDNNGIITHLENVELKVSEDSSMTPLDASLDENQIKDLFKTAPELIVSNNSALLIPLPNSRIDDNNEYNWKLEKLWKYIGTKNKHPDIMNNLYLLVYRNFLTEESRNYNNVQVDTQYGLLRTIQRTTINANDEWNTNGLYKLQINQIPLSGIAPNVFAENNMWNFDPVVLNAENRTVSCNSRIHIDLNILSLLGFNYSYAVKNGKSDMYEYTSVSFAWGVKNGNTFERISDYSIPLIIDRNMCKIEEKISNNTLYYDISAKGDYELQRFETTSYYIKPAIFMWSR